MEPKQTIQNTTAAAEATSEKSRNDQLDALRTAAAGYYEAMAEAAGDLADQAKQVYEASCDQVRRHPGSYLLGAAALGLLLGVLLDRD